jgi:hypothetical protein
MLYRAVATEDLEEETDTLPEAPVTLAVPDEPWAIRRDDGLTFRLLLDELLSLLSSARAGKARIMVRAVQMKPLNKRRLSVLVMAVSFRKMCCGNNPSGTLTVRPAQEQYCKKAYIFFKFGLYTGLYLLVRDFKNLKLHKDILEL